jgi:hypothetical protein
MFDERPENTNAVYAISDKPMCPPIAPTLEKRIREALATPGRPGVRVIAKQFGVDPGTVQRISRPFDGGSVAVA